MSPGSRPRPSLSAAARDHGDREGGVSPGSRPRPSLSDVYRQRVPCRRGVSPGSRPRPSLSVSSPCHGYKRTPCVAGVSAPAFVERITTFRISRPLASVAGVSAPAFVERSKSDLASSPNLRVSPGSRPRPSLSGVRVGTRANGPRGVAGVSAPAFVERAAVTVTSGRRVSPGSRPRPSLSGLQPSGIAAAGECRRDYDLCRRGLGPGLR